MLNDEKMFDYIEKYSSKPMQTLIWLEKQTHLRTNHSRMLCGKVEGKLLEFISRMIKPRHILEIGAFTGYSSICLASGLPDGGRLDSLEINDELEDLILEAHKRSGLDGKIDLYIGDAVETMSRFIDEKRQYDLVFIDANKRQYPDYLRLAKQLVVSGGWIVADNVLWDGKVYADTISNDAQTQAILEFNKLVESDDDLENVIIPIRDGINIIRKW